MQLLESRADLIEQAGSLAIVRQQLITDEFLSELASERLAKAHMRAGEHDRVASVPTTVIDVWLRAGFDFYKASAREIVARLRAENLEAFIATPKAV